LIKKDNFDYTQWRQELYKDQTIDEIYNDAVAFAKNKKEPE
jgi:hypothetical protein